MIHLVPYVLRDKIHDKLTVPKERIFFRLGQEGTAEAANSEGELKLPMLSLWRTEITHAPVRSQRERGRSGIAFEPLDALPTGFRNVRIVPRDLHYNLELYAASQEYVDEILKRWAFWEEGPEGVDSSLQIPIYIEGRVNEAGDPDPITFTNIVSFGDPLDVSETGYEEKGVLFHWTLPLIVHSWLLGFDTRPSILQIQAKWDMTNSEGSTITVETQLIPTVKPSLPEEGDS